MTHLVLLIVTSALVLALAGASHLYYWNRKLTLVLQYASSELLKTPDGACIELRHLSPSPAASEQPLPPVLLVHGVASNHRNQDVHPDYSLARYLTGLGRDVWLLTLRSGVRASFRFRQRVHFEAMVKFDLPLAIHTILERTGAEKLDYVGFSMGGMLLYGALGRSISAEEIRRAVLVGSPGRVIGPFWVPSFLHNCPSWLIPPLPLRWIAMGLAFASEWLSTPVHKMFLNPLNIPPGLTRLAMVNAIENIPGALNADFVHWAARDGIIRVDGQPILSGLSNTCVPALFVAGSADRLAPIKAVHHAFEAWGRNCASLPKRFLVLGRDVGSKQDYGHGDLVVGAHIGVELFEPVARFLGPENQPDEEPRPQEGAEAVSDVKQREPVEPPV